MKKNFKLCLSTAAILVSSIAVLTACSTSFIGEGNKNNANGVGAMSTQDIYAMSAVSSVSYLASDSPSADNVRSLQRRYAANAAATSRPTYVTDSDVDGMKSCIATFENILLGGGFEQTVQENASTDTRFSSYSFVMNISMPVGSGETAAYTMYFNELNKTVHSEMDGFEKETEERTTFEGVILYGEELFVVKGLKEVETEGRETETSIEFRTYKNIGVESVQADESNFVLISQSVENDEVEYGYAFYENGRKVQEIEIEYEEERSGVELSFQIKDVTSGKVQETEYELRKKDNGFLVEFEKNGREDFILITAVENGYKFVYTNGFEEIVN